MQSTCNQKNKYKSFHLLKYHTFWVPPIRSESCSITLILRGRYWRGACKTKSLLLRQGLYWTGVIIGEWAFIKSVTGS